MTVRIFCFLALAAAVAGTAEAQLVQSSRSIPAKPDPQKPPVGATGQAAAAEGGQVQPLTQLAFQLSGEGATARVQALELYLQPDAGKNRWRFWINTQLPLRSDGQEASSGAGPEPGEYLKAQLADEHGGLLNASLGHHGRLSRQQADGKARAGFWLDARGGLKLIELPAREGDEASLFSTVSPFWTGVATLMYRLPLYGGDNGNGGREDAGGLTFGLTVAGSYAGDEDFQTVFATPLARGVGHVKAHTLISIPSLGELELSGLLRSSDPFASKRLMVALHARRK